MTDLEYIREQTPEEVLFLQLAEEASELAQAALKMHRVIDGRNPTPVRMSEAWANLQEEVADVLLCLRVLGIEYNLDEYGGQMNAKCERWAERLREVQYGQ